MSEHQMEELLGVLRDLRSDLKCVILCIILSAMTRNRKLTAQEYLTISKVMRREWEVAAMFEEYLTYCVKQERKK